MTGTIRPPGQLRRARPGAGTHRAAVAAFLGAVAALLLPAPAAAHLVNTGLGPFYDGLGHFALSPADLLAVVAAALLAGLRGAAHGRAALVLLPAAWLVGGLLGLLLTPPESPALAAAALVGLGALAAADAGLTRRANGALLVAVGLALGFLNGGAVSTTPGAVLALVGIGAAVFTLAALVSAPVTLLRDGPPRIAARVGASWIAAIGILLLGWTLRGLG